MAAEYTIPSITVTEHYTAAANTTAVTYPALGAALMGINPVIVENPFWSAVGGGGGGGGSSRPSSGFLYPRKDC